MTNFRFFRTGILCLLTLVAIPTLYAQESHETQPVIYNLIMEGAGVRGVAYGGALSELEQNGKLDSLKRVGGTSSGAINATFLAIGYSADKIASLIYQTNFSQFREGELFFAGGIARLFNRFGWYKSDDFYHWSSRLIEAKTGNAAITFRQLHGQADSAGFLDLFITGTNLSRQQAVIFSYETYPDMQIRDAMRISMSIPFYYTAIFVDSSGKVYEQPAADRSVMIDGGVSQNYPIEMFDHPRYWEGKLPANLDSTDFINTQTLGLRLEREVQKSYEDAQLLAPYDIQSFRDFVEAFNNYLIKSANQGVLPPYNLQRTITISTAGIELRGVRLKESEKDTLVKSGRTAVKTYLEELKD